MKRKLLNGIRPAAGPLMVLLGLACTSPALATDLNPRQVGMYVANATSRWWSVSDIAVSGTRAYVLSSDFNDSSQSWVNSLLILDVNDPRNPTLLGTYTITSPTLWRITVSGNNAYVAAEGDGLIVIDVSNPSAPRRVGGYNTTGNAFDLLLVGSYAYVADGPAGLVVLDISNPASPRRVGSLGGVGQVRQVAVSGNYAYLADRFWNGIHELQEFGALRIVDIRNPANPQLVASYPVEGQAWSVGVVGNTAYVGASEFEIFDVSDPANSFQIGTYGGVTWWGGTLPGERAYLNYVGAGGMIVVDISNPVSPRRLGGYPAEGVVSGRYAYVKVPGGVGIVDLDQPANLRRVGSLDTPGNASAVAISGNRAFIVDGNAGLQVIDIADPTKPVLRGNYPTSQPARFVAASGNYAYVVESWDNGGGSYGAALEILDVSNPAAPQSAGNYQTTGYLGSLAATGNHAYLGLSSPDRVEVIDLSTPANPQQIAVYDNIGFPSDLAVTGHQLVVAHNRYPDTGLVVLDITNPASPQPVGSYSATNSSFLGVAVSGTRAYVTGSAGFQVFGLSDPMKPSLLGSNTNFGSGWRRLAVSGNYAYGADGFRLQVVDVSNPASPRLVGGNSAVWANALVVSGTNLFVAGGLEGLQVFDLALSTPPPPPVLTTIRSGSTLTIAWPASATGAVLETTSQLPPAASWSPASEAPVTVGDQKVVTIQIGAGSRFFRLKLQ